MLDDDDKARTWFTLNITRPTSGQTLFQILLGNDGHLTSHGISSPWILLILSTFVHDTNPQHRAATSGCLPECLSISKDIILMQFLALTTTLLVIRSFTVAKTVQ